MKQSKCSTDRNARYDCLKETVIPYFFTGGNSVTFDAGTWWLVGILLTSLLGVVGGLVSRSIFKQIDENRSDIKEVRENYTTRNAHLKDIEAVRNDMKEMRAEVRTEIQTMSGDVRDIKENCIRREEFLQSQLKLEGKLDKLMDYVMKGGMKHD